MLRTLFAIVVFLTLPCGVMGCSGCDQSSWQPGYVQVLVGRYDAGLTTIDGFRLTASGDLSHASWSDQNILLGMSHATSLGDSAFAAVKDQLATLEPQPVDPPDALPPPPVLTVEMIVPGRQGKRYLVYRNEIPETLVRILQDWRKTAPLQKASAGHYVWAMPVLAAPGLVDLSIPDKDHSETLAGDVSKALMGAHLVVPAVGDVAGFMVGGREYRSRFVAKLDGEFAYFGVLAVR